MKNLKIASLYVLAFIPFCLTAQNPFHSGGPVFSTNGFFKLPGNDSRIIYSFNNGWLYHKGDIKNAKEINASDADWQQVQLPHGVDILPEEASGGINYQGIVWYRKHFIIPEKISHKKLSLTFEAIMGKCSIYLNGELIASHKGGYLPITIDLSANHVKLQSDNVIAVMTDNSDDPSYPPGKPEYALDFCYFGGIYRNTWLTATNSIHITDANIIKKDYGNGVFVSFDNVSKKQATVNVAMNLINESGQSKKVTAMVTLKDKDGNIVAENKTKLSLAKGKDATASQTFTIKGPLLWHPDHPYLYDLYTTLLDDKNQVIDGYYQRVGVKSVILKGKEGMYLNGEPFNDKLMGANHHQDYPYVGNAVPDNLAWNDAKKLRDAGIRILRLSHYPQSNAFMDACDELGIFTIVPTPGWQFWNNDTSFVELMYSDIRQMVRRDRNHACIFAWEPIPNETRYPDYFAKNAYNITHREDPNKNCIAACDYGSAAWQMFDLLYAHPFSEAETHTDKCLFTREWGDNVDNWSAHNSPSRASIAWGEIPQLIQAMHYANPPYKYDCWEMFYETPKQLLGGCLWHSFDTQRGYHPDPFYGGIVDFFRQPKFSYELFKSQQSANSPYVQQEEKDPYNLFIANIMSPFSPADVTVYTNCDSVKLIAYGKDSMTLAPDQSLKMPHPMLVFKNVFHFMDIKDLTHEKLMASDPDWSSLMAIGYANGKEVIRVTRKPAKRPSKLKLVTDLEGRKPLADGNFIIPVFAEMQDENGLIQRLNESLVHFSVKGEGLLIGKDLPGINPHKIIWGTAPALVRTTLKAGTIEVIASMEYPGEQTPASDTLYIETQPATIPSLFSPQYVTNIKDGESEKPRMEQTDKLSEAEKKKAIQQVEKDQTHFMGDTPKK